MGLNDKICKFTDWQTPDRIKVPVKAYFLAAGHHGIELDPATSADNSVGAACFYTEKDDGLSMPWGERATFLNPPYGKALRTWVAKIHEEARKGCHLVALLPGQRFETGYWQEDVLNQWLTAIVFIRRRVSFVKPGGGEAKSNPFGSILWIYNGREDLARREFAGLGLVVIPKKLETADLAAGI